MEYFIIWEVHGNSLRIVESSERIFLFKNFSAAEKVKNILEKSHSENKYFIRLFREPEIINALNK